MVVQLKKKLITLISMMVILFVLLAGAPFTVQASSPFAGGDGSAAAPFLIETAEQLDAIRHNMSAHYKLNADIDLSGRNWVPLGGFFAGLLDGAGYKIIGLTIDTDEVDVGLFKQTDSSAMFKNISLVDVNIRGGNYVGALVGLNKGTIEHSFASGSVSGRNNIGGLIGASWGDIVYSCADVTVHASVATAGGLVGRSGEGASIKYSCATGNVSSTGDYAGGLAGYHEGKSGVLQNSYATGNVRGWSRVGGLIGETKAESVLNSYATGTATGVNLVGGLIGLIDGTVVRNSYAAGKVKGSGGIAVGGLAGDNLGNKDSVINSYYDKDTTGQSDRNKGEAKTTEQMKQRDTFSGWDFDEIWEIDLLHNDGYPYLKNIQAFITYDGNGHTEGTAPYDGTSYKPGDLVEVKGNEGNLKRTGYTFEGWNTQSDGQGMDYAPGETFNAKEVSILFAKWLGIPYKITFDPQGGTVEPATPQQKRYGSTYGTDLNGQPEPLPVPLREEYRFAGWYNQPDGQGIHVTDDAIVSTIADHTLYAYWTANTYNIIFDSMGGTEVDSQTVVHGNKATEPEQPERTGYTFAGWYTDEELTIPFAFTTPITGYTTLYAKWQIHRYTLTYFAGAGGSIDGETLQTVDHGDDGTTVTALPDEGYHFVQWSDGNTVATRTDENVTANVNVTAEFAMNGYAVSFESNGGSKVDSQTVNYGGIATEPPAPTQTGYTFVGWFVDIDLMTPFDFMTPITKDVTLYAKWTINSYTVIFEENGGTAVDSQTVNHGDTAAEPDEPTRLGYAFDGWHTDMDLTVPFNFSTPIVGDVTLYAKWRLPEQVAKPRATPSGGEVLFGTSIVLNTTTVEASIYYTTDGSEPSISSMEYTGSIEVTNEMTLKAIAVKEEMLDSDVLTEHYTIATLRAPADLTATPSDHSVILNWQAVAKENGVTYAIYQVEGDSAPVDPTDWELVQANITANTFTVTGLTNGKTYAFAVKAIYAEGESDFSNVAIATPKAEDDGGGSGGDGGSGGGPGGGHGDSGGGITGDSGMVLSPTGVITIPTGRSGEVRLDDEIIIKVSSGAAEQELHITIEKLRDTLGLLTDQETLVSQVFEVLKNFSGNFKKPITLSIKFDPTKVGKNQKVAIFYYDEDRKIWVEVGGTVEGEWITAEVDHFTKFAVLAVEGKKEVDVNKESDGETPKQLDPTFTDIAEHWGERFIMDAAKQGIVSGYPDGTFKPNNPVTRTEFTVMLVGALKLDGTTGAALQFKDQDKIGAWAKRAVALAVQAGIVSGYEDGSFRPDAQITRAEMASMIAKALKMSLDANVTTSFADDEDIPKWAKGAVETIRKLGIVSGRGGNKFVPNDKATRAEAVVMLLRMLEHRD